MKRYESKYNPAVKDISDYIHEGIKDGRIRPDVLAKITRVLDGVEVTDNLLVQKDNVINQKTVEVQSKDSLLVQKEKEEFIEVLQRLDPSYTDHIGDWPNNIYKEAVINGNPKLISDSLPILKQSLLTKEFIIVLNKINPEIYKTDIVSLNSNQFSSAVSNWPDNIYKQAVIENNVEGIKLITDSLPILKGRYLLKNEFIEILHKLDPESYPKNFEDWSVSRGKELIDNEDYATISSIIPIYRKELEKKLVFQRENELAVKEQLLIDQHKKEIEDLKALVVQKELENQKLLIQKEEEIHNKSFVKNQVINELQEDVGLKEQEAYKLQIELLTKQLEAAREIAKQKGMNTELVEQNEILGLKIQYYDMEVRNKETEKEILLTQKQKMSFLLDQKNKEFQNALIQKEIEQKELLLAKELAVADKSFEKNQIIEQLREEIEGLSKQLLDNQPIYRSIYLEDRSCQPGESLVERQMESLDLSSINLSPINQGGQNQNLGILNNLSPNVHVGNNPVQNPLAFINDFDINNVHTTNSVYPSGEGSESFVIVDTENIH